MKLFIFALVLLNLILTTSLIYCGEAPDVSIPGITDINSDNADSFLDGSKGTLVEFYAPWCGHCKNLTPEMKKLGEALEKAKSSSVQVGKVNCDEHKSVCSKYGVKGYPTLKWFPKGSTEPEDYNKGRTVEALVEFINSKDSNARLRIVKAPTFVEELTPSNFDSIVMDENKDVFVKFFAPWCGHCKKMAPDYEKVAKAFSNENNVVVAHVDVDKHRDIGSRFGVKGFPTLKFFPRGSSDKTPLDYKSGRDVDSLMKYINEKAGTSRNADGSLSSDAGVVEQLADYVKQFGEASNKDEKESIIEKVKGELKSLTDQHPTANYYVKVMSRIVEKGADYVEKEMNRLQNIMSKGAIAGDKIDYMKKRTNILKLFK